MTSETMNKINIGAEIVDVVFKALGIPVSFSSKIKLIENVMSAGETNPKIQLRNNIADSIDKIVKESNISDVDAEAVKDNVKESLKKVTEQDYIDNISSPQSLVDKIINNHTDLGGMLMYGKEASNRKQEIDRQHYTIPNQRPKDKHCGKI
ncbi:MAG: hypothetical protein U0L73_01960 [Ruminococcus bromii]|nr:hypothetical protein [Ruminococcus bromii]